MAAFFCLILTLALALRLLWVDIYRLRLTLNHSNPSLIFGKSEDQLFVALPCDELAAAEVASFDS